MGLPSNQVKLVRSRLTKQASRPHMYRNYQVQPRGDGRKGGVLSVIGRDGAEARLVILGCGLSFSTMTTGCRVGLLPSANNGGMNRKQKVYELTVKQAETQGHTYVEVGCKNGC